MAKEIKLSDIARRLGVSTVTVSRALAGKSGVSDKKREEIKQIADEIGYKRVNDNRDNVKKDKGTIGVIIAARYLYGTNSFYWAIYQEIVKFLAKKNLYGMLEILLAEDEERCSIPKMIYDNKVDGVIIIGQLSSNYSKFIFNLDYCPNMFLDFYDSENNYDSIISDGFYGMYRMINYLFKKGHRDIAFVGTPFTTSSITDRYFGYCKALQEKGIKVKDEWKIDDRDFEGAVFREYDFPDEMPTAIACNCDYTAKFVIDDLRKKGFLIPEDISVVGFDNFIASDYSNIGITTYSVPMEKMAEKCVETIIKKINKEEYQKGIQIITGDIIEKDTVKDINKNSSR